MPINAQTHSFVTAIVDSKEALFVRRRVDPDTVPDGLYLYDVGYHENDLTFATISHHLRRRFAGTLLLKETLGIKDGAVQQLPNDFCITGTEQSLLEYVTGKQLRFHPAPKSEAALFYPLPHDKEMASGIVAHIAIEDTELQTWLIHRLEPDQDSFLEQSLMMAMIERENKYSIIRFCEKYPDAVLEKPREYGFRADTPNHAYYMRVDKNGTAYTNVYDRARLEQYLGQNPERDPSRLITHKFYNPRNAYRFASDPHKPEYEAYEYLVRQDVKLKDSPKTLKCLHQHFKETRPDVPGGLIRWYHKNDGVKDKIQDIYLDIELRGDTVWMVGVCQATAPLSEEQEQEFKVFWKEILGYESRKSVNQNISSEFGWLNLALYSDALDWGVYSEAELDGQSSQIIGPTIANVYFIIIV